MNKNLNNINCIMSNPRTGKTTKLIEEFVKGYEDKIYKSIFVTCEETDRAISEKCRTMDYERSRGVITGREYNVVMCDSKTIMLSVIINFITANPYSKIYVDMPEIYIKDFNNYINIFVTKYKDIDGSVNITWTKSIINLNIYRHENISEFLELKSLGLNFDVRTDTNSLTLAECVNAVGFDTDNYKLEFLDNNSKMVISGRNGVLMEPIFVITTKLEVADRNYEDSSIINPNEVDDVMENIRMCKNMLKVWKCEI